LTRGRISTQHVLQTPFGVLRGWCTSKYMDEEVHLPSYKSPLEIRRALAAYRRKDARPERD
jgi:hypothetical protein